MVNIEVYRKIGQLLLSCIITLILLKYELIFVEILLLILSLFEIIINKKMYNRLKNIQLT